MLMESGKALNGFSLTPRFSAVQWPKTQQEPFRRFLRSREKPLKRLGPGAFNITRLKPGVNGRKELAGTHPNVIHTVSVPEVSDASEDHRHVALIRGSNHFLVAD